MIKEAYVFFEVAKLLKEKGFDEKTMTYYEDEILCNGDWYEWNRSPLGHTAAPTHQMAMAWLREVHKIVIIIYPFSETVSENTAYTIDICTPSSSRKEGHLRGVWKTYEEAVEAALKDCLENLL